MALIPPPHSSWLYWELFKSVIAGTKSAAHGACAGFTRTLVQSVTSTFCLKSRNGRGNGGAEEKGAQVLGKAYWSAA